MSPTPYVSSSHHSNNDKERLALGRDDVGPLLSRNFWRSQHLHAPALIQKVGAVTKNWCFSELLPQSERASSIFTTAAARDKVLNINPLKVYNAGSSLKQKHFEPHT